ncbi:Zinc finger CCCH domain-containing protein 46 [Zea mays]|uniref:Zinc finger CCCH domain-containing protein 46 n=1 Tax=Zea mays TaxID=4577 RepID=A0A1D6L572_MAIZE|nr:Zinc finger CCCH domain-containing protein 46 [Zea mays]
MLLGGEDMHRFPVRSPRMDRDDLIRSPAARRIVSNYFGYPEHTPPLLAPLLRLFRFVSTSRSITLPRHRWTEQHVRADVGRAHPVPAEAHVRLRHLRVRRDGEGHPEQGQPALRVRRALVKPYKEKGKVPGRFSHIAIALHEAAARAPWRSRVRWLRVAHRIAGFQGPLRPPASFKCPGFLLSMKPLGYDV